MGAVARKEIERLINREVQGRVRRSAWNRRGEWEALSDGGAGGSNPERFVHHDRYWRGPLKAERSVGNFIEQGEDFNRSIVKAESCPNARLAGTAKNFT